MDPTSMPSPDQFTQMVTTAFQALAQGKWGLVFPPVLWALVWTLRRSIPRWRENPAIKDWVPAIAAIAGAAAGAAVTLAAGALPAVVIAAVVTGFVGGLMSTGGYEFITKLPALGTALLALFSSKWKAKRAAQIEERKTVDAAKAAIRSGSLVLGNDGKVFLAGKPFGPQP